MGTLSLNTSVTSTHRTDFYSATDETEDSFKYWIRLKNVCGNYFDYDSNCSSGNSKLYCRIHGTDRWIDTSGCSHDYYYKPCYQACCWNWNRGSWIYVRYSDPDNPDDPDNYKYIDKIAFTLHGLRAESFVNRCFININVKDTLNSPLRDVEVYRRSVVDSTEFLVQICSNLCHIDPISKIIDFTDITPELRNCNTSVPLMQSQKENDVVMIGTYGIPDKLTFTIATAGVYSGTLHWQYWNGYEWTYFPDNIIDNTNGFKNSGTNDVILPSVPDWQRIDYGVTPEYIPLYWCRAIYDSTLTVTTVPKASCFRWTGLRIHITDSNGNISLTKFSSGGTSIGIIGKLPGYICQSGCNTYTITEALESLDINMVLFESDLACEIKCPTTPTYKYQKKNVLVTSSVGSGSIRNIIEVIPPVSDKYEITNISSGTDIPVEIDFSEVGLYKIKLISKDDGDNVCYKSCHVNVREAPSCSVYTDKISCEEAGCYWQNGRCTSESYVNELVSIYESIISDEVCLPIECLPDLDLDNDEVISDNDITLAKELTEDEALSILVQYDICKYTYKCKEKIPVQVTFKSISTNNPTEYDWDFGDGVTITKTTENPIAHVYNNIGKYNVKHKAYNSCGPSLECNKIISVYPEDKKINLKYVGIGAGALLGGYAIYKALPRKK